MNIEYEATFTNIDKDDMRRKLKESGGILTQPEYLQKRVVFNMPEGRAVPGGWLRVRDEGNKITMSFKITDGNKIEDTKELMLCVDDFKRAEELLTILGCQKKAYQENRRELWHLDNTEITIDEWPFLEPYIEVEGPSEEAVRAAAEKLGFDYNAAIFGPVTVLYAKKYNLPEDTINNKIPKIIFDMENPFRAS